MIAKPYELTGEDVRFLRKYLELSAAEFANILSVDKSTLSRWENGDRALGPQSDRLIRTVVLGLGEGMKEKLEQQVRSFPEIKKTSKADAPGSVYRERKKFGTGWRRQTHICQNRADMGHRHAAIA